MQKLSSTYHIQYTVSQKTSHLVPVYCPYLCQILTIVEVMYRETNTFSSVIDTELKRLLLTYKILFALSDVLLTLVKFSDSDSQSLGLLDQHLVAVLQRSDALVGCLLL